MVGRRRLGSARAGVIIGTHQGDGLTQVEDRIRKAERRPVVDDIERQRASEAAPRGLWSAWSMKSMILYLYLSALCFHSPNISRA